MSTTTDAVPTIENSHLAPSMAAIAPPYDPLKDVFSQEVKDAWHANTNEELIYRLRILCACGPYPSDPYAAHDLRCFRAKKAAWETYLFTAFALGFFQGQRGQDLRARLCSRDADGFRSAIAECMACWFLAGRLKLPLDPVAPGRGKKNLDMRIVLDGRDVGVEVKSPFREHAEGRVWCAGDSKTIAQVMVAANKQLADNSANLLILVPSLRRRLFTKRDDVIRAAFGESKITWQVNTQTGERGPTKPKFFPDGKFLNTERPGGAPLKPDGFPGYRRISAVVCIEETFREKYPFPNPCDLLDEETRGEIWPLWERARDLHFSPQNDVRVDYDVLVLHNPYAYFPVAQDVWVEFPQLVPVGDIMEWTDGEEVLV